MEFSECELGDKRRTQRLISTAAKTLAWPDGSSTKQTETWADCKALYRLMDCDDVSFQAITTPHYERTRRNGDAGSVRLILNDTTEINYGGKRRAKGLGPVGRNTGRGFFLHSALMRDPDSKQVIGLAGQELLYRPKKKKPGAKNARRRDPQREQAVWGRLIDQVGSPPPGATWLHVCDRGADDYEVFCRAYRQGCGWVIRACRLNRQVISPTGERITLKEHLAAQPVRGLQTLDVPATAKRSARTAQLELRFAPLSLPQPKVTNAWIREHAPGEPLAMWAVELLEVHPPTEKERVRWVLLTSQPVETVEQAQQIVDYYAQRWAIEEYHKALKTGCQVEARYYREAERLERITGLLSIVAVQLLRLRNLADEQPDAIAADVAPKKWVETIAKVRQGKSPRSPRLDATTMTLADFIKHLGGLGGHLGRKCDGRPGWQTLWCGLEKLLLILRGCDLAEKKCG
ncbi:IS4 family transposase [Blastopirellula sp. JC732]|uniref:IS4 family transposase n=1 Tax=Blastopirellula sediminis TaxID=2894196 RepID=A0A9X1MJI7_9BACT|nr:IS4 family transposase [Blastopirellula sediminis]MCC9607710.1 IS4 family transposase [Blastopirellula sediminis]MCC9627497.1 IS4 family transposase [Blastopirellula sediminis]